MDKYTIPCTEEQTRKALKLGAPIESVFGKVLPTTANKCNLAVIEDLSYDIPTAEQMLGWLEEQGVFISIVPDTDENTCANYIETKESSICNAVHSSRKEATLDAIDAALDYLIDNK